MRQRIVIGMGLVLVGSAVFAQDVLPTSAAAGGSQMAAQAIGVCSVLAVTISQLIKFSLRPSDRFGVLIVAGISAAVVALWAWDKSINPRGNLYELAMSWGIVATSAGGVFGFSRAATGAVGDMVASRKEATV